MRKKTFLAIVLILFLILYFLFLRPTQIISKEEAKIEGSVKESKFLIWKGNEIHFTERGNGENVLLIHGFGGSYYNFEALSKKLAINYRVINIDLPGSGLSDFNNTSDPNINFFNEYSDYFKFLMDTLKLDTLHVVGNSLGGAMAYTIAANSNKKIIDLVLLNSAGYELDKVIVKGAGPMRFKWTKNLVKRGVPNFVIKYFVVHPFADKSKLDTSELKFDYVLSNRAGNYDTQIDLASSHQYPDTSIIKNIKCPTLILWGKEDNIIPVSHASKFGRDIPNSEIKIYSPCGHMPQMEIVDSVYEDITTFYKKNKR